MNQDLINWRKENCYFIRVGMSDLIGMEITDISAGESSVSIESVDSNGMSYSYSLHHAIQCCESVWLEDANGDIELLKGQVVLNSYEGGSGDEDASGESWAFYHIQTNRESVVLRFCCDGGSSGCYSVAVKLNRHRTILEQLGYFKDMGMENRLKDLPDFIIDYVRNTAPELLQ